MSRSFWMWGVETHKSTINILKLFNIADPQGEIYTKTFAGHNFVSEEWAEKLYEKFQVPVVVSAGIHYDNIDSTGIETVVSELKKTLNEVLKRGISSLCQRQ